MNKAQRADYFKNGKAGESYGIWNGITKRFVYGISESSPVKAKHRHRELNPIGSRCHRYSIKVIPDGYKNPANELWKGAKR